DDDRDQRKRQRAFERDFGDDRQHHQRRHPAAPGVKTQTRQRPFGDVFFIDRIDRADQRGGDGEAGEQPLPRIGLGGADQNRQRKKQQLLLQRLRNEIDDDDGQTGLRSPLQKTPQQRLQQQPRPADDRQQRNPARQFRAALH